MKNKLNKVIAAGALVASIVPAASLAASLDLGSSNAASVGVTVGGGSSSSSANGNVNANMNVGVKAGANSSSSAMTDEMSESNATSGNITVGGTADVNANGSISINGDDARLLSDSSVAPIAAANVSSDTDLKTYAQVVARGDTSVKNVDVKGNDVSVTYERPARLFGFLPVNIKETAHVTVDANGKANVNVDKSWWSFLASDDLQSDQVTSDINASLNANAAVSANGSLTASQKAMILSAIENAESRVYANANASAHANLTASSTGSVSY